MYLGFVVCVGRFGFHGNVVTLQFSIKGSAADAEHLASEGFVAVRLLEDAEDRHAFHFRQSGCGKRSGVLGRGHCHGRGIHPDGGREVADIDDAMIAEGYRAGDTVFQLANIAGPIVLKETFHRGCGDLKVFPAGVAIEEVVDEHGNVGATIAECRKVYGYDVETEIEVLAEGAAAVGGFEIAVGSGDDAHVDVHFFVAADRTDFLFLENAEEFGLHFQRQLANFVEENCAAIGSLEKAVLRLRGSRKGTLFVAEEFTFHEGGNQRTTINRNEGGLRHGAAEMNGTGGKLLARAALTGNQNGSAGIFEARNHAQNVLDIGGGTDDAVEVFFGVDALSQEFVFRYQANFFGHALQQQAHFFDAKGLFDVVVGTKFHGIDGRLDGAMAGHDGDFGSGHQRFDLAQEFDARLAGKF